MEGVDNIVRIPTGEGLTLWNWAPFVSPDVRNQEPFKAATTYIWASYKHALSTLVHVLRANRWRHSANVCGALGLELFSCLKDEYNRFWDTKKDYKEFGVNPLFLSKELAEKRAILLLHGKGGNEGQMRELARYINNSQKLGPVFTLNLNSGEMTMEDTPLVEDKLDSIRKLYSEHGKSMKFDIVGYSRGAEYAHYIALKKDSWEIRNGFCYYKQGAIDSWREEFGKMIRIGSVLLETEKTALNPSMLSAIYEVTGEDDILMPQRSLMEKEHQFHIKSGHVGLMQSDQCFEWVVKVLSSSVATSN